MERFAFIFPGQGSQKIGMLSSISPRYSIVKNTFREASKILGYDLWNLVQRGPIEELNKTWQTQPALLTTSVSLWRIWQHSGTKIKPMLVAGHSLGEYSALVCAGVINFSDAVHLVKMRGMFMQEAVPEGVGLMAVIIGLDNNFVTTTCKELAKNQVVSPANFNSPNQIVIAGHKEAVKRVCAACRTAGSKKVLELAISVPSHCILMKPAAEKLERELEKIYFGIPEIPVLNSIDVKYKTSPGAIKKALIQQLYSPVQWTKTIKFIFEQEKVRHLYEIGPGRVLTRLTRSIIKKLSASSILDEFDTTSTKIIKL